jgi:hypothetical protein
MEGEQRFTGGCESLLVSGRSLPSSSPEAVVAVIDDEEAIRRSLA